LNLFARPLPNLKKATHQGDPVLRRQACRLRTQAASLILAAGLVAGCLAQDVTQTPASAPALNPSPTPALPIDDRIRDSFRQSDPDTRKDDVLQVTDAFLRNASVKEMSDEAASVHFTKVAFSSERLTFSDPAFIRRQDEWAVVGLPDGIGLFLYDLSAEPGTQPLELSSWTIGLSAVEVTWRRSEIGVRFITVGNDDVTRVHFILVTRPEDTWQVVWFSDEQPDWWFNAYDATLSVAPNLTRLVVVGKSLDTTDVFYEYGQEDTPLREFRVEWVRQEDNRYLLSPPAGAYPSRQAWLWQIAKPSGYATLVEFIERLRSGDEAGIAALVTSPVIISAASSFGLYLPDRRYKIVLANEGTIVFRDRLGVFVATFAEPEAEGDPWLITDISPLGAEGATPTPTQPGG
jgi:hypothetical protein